MHWKPIDIALFCAWLVFVIVGFIRAPDYGLGWDEPVSRQSGMITHQYVVHGDITLFSYKDRYYGTGFEWPMYALERFSGLSDPFDVFVLRHRVTFVIFAVAVLVWYQVAASLFGGRVWGVLAVLFLVLHPRIGAESFYNPKDIVFLSACVFACAALYWYMRLRSWHALLVSAVAVSWATDIRIIGLLLHGVIFVDFVLQAREGRKQWRKHLWVYGAVSMVLTIAFWPFLWEQPVTRFIEAIRYSVSFDEFQKTVLYFGTYMPAHQIPWHYVSVWIGITTPVGILAFFCIGLCRSIGIGAPWLRVMAIWIVASLVLAAASGAELYDGWRQFYFLYPAIVMLAVYGCVWVWNRAGRVKYMCALILALHLVDTGYFVVQQHPHQYVYFNALIGGIAGAKGQFDMDYWGVSFRRGLEYIARIDDRPRIPVFLAFGVKAAVDVIEAQDRRFVPVDRPEQADYILSNFRWQENEPPYPVVFTLAVDDVAILRVYDRRLDR
jgi:hypothetical protein